MEQTWAPRPKVDHGSRREHVLQRVTSTQGPARGTGVANAIFAEECCKLLVGTQVQSEGILGGNAPQPLLMSGLELKQVF